MNDLADRRHEEKERRRAEILDATEAVAASEGWEDMTMDQVARRARLSARSCTCTSPTRRI